MFLQQSFGDLRGILHLGNGLGADKAGALELLYPGGQDSLNDLQLSFGGDHHAADALKSVSGTDFSYGNMLVHMLTSLC